MLTDRHGNEPARSYVHTKNENREQNKTCQRGCIDIRGIL